VLTTGEKERNAAAFFTHGTTLSICERNSAPRVTFAYFSHPAAIANFCCSSIPAHLDDCKLEQSDGGNVRT
jgi:hypothetical protein